MLGTAVAAGCSKRTAPTGWDGTFVADGSKLGHRLRDAKGGVDWPESKLVDEVLVLGGGVSGLTAAWALKKAGKKVRVLELGAQPGGTSAAGHSEVTAYPWGAHYVPAPTAENADLVELLTELGAVESRTKDRIEYAEHMLCAAPKERIFYQGSWQAGLTPSLGQNDAEIAQWARFTKIIDTWVAFRDKEGRRAFTLPMALGSEAPEVRALDQISFAQWLKRHQFTAPRLLWYAAYACRDDFGLLPEETSAYYGLHYFCSRVPQAGQDSAEFLTWPQGNGRIVEHLVAQVGAANIHTEQAVLQVQPDEHGVQVGVYDGTSAEYTSYRATKVVFALPSYLRKYLLKDAPDYSPGYAPWMVANVHLDKRPGYRGFETAWDNVIYDSASLGYVVANHQTQLAVGPTVWTWYLPLVGDPKQQRRDLQSLSHRQASDSVFTDLDRCHSGLKAAVSRIDLRRWGHGMVRPEVGMRFSSARQGAAAPWRGLHFAHTDLSGMALVEEAVFHGIRAAREVIAG